jgi:hypothetical protein
MRMSGYRQKTRLSKYKFFRWNIMAAFFDLSMLITPLAVTSFLLVARVLGGRVAGFMCGLPYASAPMIYAIAMRFGDSGVLDAIRSAIGVTAAFLCVAMLYSLHLRSLQRNRSDDTKTPTKPSIAIAVSVGLFVFAMGLVAKLFGASYAGILAGLPIGSVCVFCALRVKSGRMAAADCARGFVAGQSITVMFLIALLALTTPLGFQYAFAFCMTGIMAAVALRAANSRTRSANANVAAR